MSAFSTIYNVLSHSNKSIIIIIIIILQQSRERLCNEPVEARGQATTDEGQTL